MPDIAALAKKAKVDPETAKRIIDEVIKKRKR
jgi:(2Fe-2S) ferredoxin